MAEEFRTTIARAREAQAVALIDGTLEMADAATPENWRVVRMQIWARQWFASKVAPRTYGDKVQHANAAGDGNTAIEHIFRWQDDPEPKQESVERDSPQREVEPPCGRRLVVQQAADLRH
jgi:hypothetical protein